MKSFPKIILSIFIVLACSENPTPKIENETNTTLHSKALKTDTLKLVEFSASQEGDCYLSNSKYSQGKLIQLIDTFDCGDYGGEILKETYLKKELKSFSYLTLEVDTIIFTKKFITYNSKDSSLKTGIDTGSYLILSPVKSIQTTENCGVDKAIQILQKIKTTR